MVDLAVAAGVDAPDPRDAMHRRHGTPAAWHGGTTVKERKEPEHLQILAVGPIGELDAIPHGDADRDASDWLDAVHGVDVPLDGRIGADATKLLTDRDIVHVAAVADAISTACNVNAAEGAG